MTEGTDPREVDHGKPVWLQFVLTRNIVGSMPEGHNVNRYAEQHVVRWKFALKLSVHGVRLVLIGAR
jgi:hypothetical protein